MTEQEHPFYDQNVFIFSFESHGRCETPQRFAVKRELKDKALVNFDKNDNAGFVWFCVDYVGCFWLGNETSNSFCADLSCAFEGIQNTTLTGKNSYNSPPYHRCTRVVAIQLSSLILLCLFPLSPPLPIRKDSMSKIFIFSGPDVANQPPWLLKRNTAESL